MLIMTPVRQIPYRTVHGRTLSLHVLSTGTPLAVFFHGGGWVRGDWTQFRPQAAHLADLGVGTVLVEYRTEGPHAAVDDTLLAMATVFERSEELNAAPGQVVTIGGSAGGHLALMATLFPEADPRHRPAATILLNPVTDTTGEFPQAFGRRHFATADEATRYSPLHQLGPHLPPTLIMHGTADTAVHHQNSVTFADRAGATANPVELVLYPGQRHGFFNPTPTRRYHFEVTTNTMAQFLLARALG